MIRITNHNEIITMYIKMNFEHSEIFEFLHKKGYTVQAFVLQIPAEKGFLTDEPATERYTFTATKSGEEPSEKNLFLKVFEKEFKKLLKL